MIFSLGLYFFQVFSALSVVPRRRRYISSARIPWKKVRMNFPLRKWMKTDRALGWEPNYLNEFKFIYGGLFVTTLTCIQFPVVVNQ